MTTPSSSNLALSDESDKLALASGVLDSVRPHVCKVDLLLAEATEHAGRRQLTGVEAVKRVRAALLLVGEEERNL